MTKEKLLYEVSCYAMDIASMEEVETAVDRYTNAIIAQSKCSTTLELLQQMFDKEQKLNSETDHYSVQVSTTRKMEAIENVMKIIKEPPPMLYNT